jgi:hypothetical protein
MGARSQPTMKSSTHTDGGRHPLQERGLARCYQSAEHNDREWFERHVYVGKQIQIHKKSWVGASYDGFTTRRTATF